jgi:hypothetical protein
MPREARQIILGNVVAKIVEQKERIRLFCVSKAEGAAQMHARTFERRLRFDNPLYWSNGHRKPLVEKSFDVEQAIGDSQTPD